MQLHLPCSTCKKEVLARGSPDAVIGIRALLSLTPSEIHKMTCPRGHENWVWLAHPFHEILLYRGIQELAAGDTRGAALSFYSAWDNFVKHMVELYVTDDTYAIPPIGPCPKGLARSEPRLGVYAGIYVSIFKGWPQIVSEDSTKTRNKVIHDDHVPSRQEVLKLAEDVQRCIRFGFSEMQEAQQEQMWGLEAHSRGLEAFSRFLEGLRNRHVETIPEGMKMLFIGLRQSFTELDIEDAVARASSLELGEPLELASFRKEPPAES